MLLTKSPNSTWRGRDYFALGLQRKNQWHYISLCNMAEGNIVRTHHYRRGFFIISLIEYFVGITGVIVSVLPKVVFFPEEKASKHKLQWQWSSMKRRQMVVVSTISFNILYPFRLFIGNLLEEILLKNGEFLVTCY